MRSAFVVIAAVAGTTSVHADDRPAPAPAPPDEIADVESREANLESVAPRAGLVFAAAAGFGVLVGGDIGVGRGGAVSLRVGHVATRRTVITFELTGSGAQHKPAMTSKALTDTNVGLFAGAQTYVSRSTWVRLAGGPTVFTANIGGDQYTRGGVGGLAGFGLDLVRRRFLVLGFESFGMGSVSRDGFKLQLGFGLGLSYY